MEHKLHIYDAVNPMNIPASAKIVGGYVDGRYKWTDQGWNLHPQAYHLKIAVFASTDDGEVLDIEKGNATPADGPGWVKMRRQHAVDPTIYCSADTWPSVRAAFQGTGIAEPHYWIALWNNVAEVPDGAVACQYWHDIAPGYDISITNGQWPLADPVPSPTPTPVPNPTPEVNVKVHFVEVPLDANGNGSTVLDGGTNSTPNVTSSSELVSWSSFIAATSQGSDPTTDHAYWQWDCHVQDRNGFVLVTATGGIPNGQAGVYVAATA